MTKPDYDPTLIRMKKDFEHANNGGKDQDEPLFLNREVRKEVSKADMNAYDEFDI